MYGATLSLHNIEQSYFVAVQAPSTSTSHLSRPDSEDSGHDIAGLLQVVGPGSTQSELGDASVNESGEQWRPAAA